MKKPKTRDELVKWLRNELKRMKVIAQMPETLSYLNFDERLDLSFNIYEAEKQLRKLITKLSSDEVTVAAHGTCEYKCTGPWDCQCQDMIDSFYRGVERKSSEGQL